MIFTVKYDGVDDDALMSKYHWAMHDTVRELYVDSLSKLSHSYKTLKDKLALIQQCLDFNSEAFQVYEQLKSDVRVKSLTYVQKFYSVAAKYYDKGRYEQLRLKTLKELNEELFGITEHMTEIIS